MRKRLLTLGVCVGLAQWRQTAASWSTCRVNSASVMAGRVPRLIAALLPPPSRQRRSPGVLPDDLAR
jgi:hypothetical protein